MIHLTATTKIIAGAVALSLGWIVLEACDCDPANLLNLNPDPEYWVTCDGNTPKLMEYSGGHADSRFGPTRQLQAGQLGLYPRSEFTALQRIDINAPFPSTAPSNHGSARPRATGTGYPYAPEYPCAICRSLPRFPRLQRRPANPPSRMCSEPITTRTRSPEYPPVHSQLRRPFQYSKTRSR